MAGSSCLFRNVRFTAAVMFLGLIVATPAFTLPAERRGEVIYIPDYETVHAPSALAETPPERLDYARYDQFPKLYEAGGSETREHQGVDSLPAGLEEIGFDRYEALYTDDGDTLDTAVEIGLIPRKEHVPFALVDSPAPEHDNYEAILWSAELEYANLFARIGERTIIVDLGWLYNYDLESAENRGATADSAAFLPASPVRAELRWFEPLDEYLLDIDARTLISMHDPSLTPAKVRILLRPGDTALELVGYFIEELTYGDGSRYSARHELLEGRPAALREQVLRRTRLGQSTYRYRLAIGEYQVVRGRFTRSSRARTVWEQTFPQTLLVAEDEAHMYSEPGTRGKRIAEVSSGTKVRAIEPWNRLDSRDGVDGMWYRVEGAGTEGWMWAPKLIRPD